MNNFEDFKKRWQQPLPAPPTLDVGALKRDNRSHQRKLEQSQLVSGISLLITAVLLTGIGFIVVAAFKSSLTYAGLVLIIACCMVQGISNLRVYRRLHRMDVSAPTTLHLQQWEAYCQFSERLIRVNTPLYMIVLNLAFGFYFVEVLSSFTIPARIGIGVVYTAWMLFAYFVLGRRKIRNERKRLGEIIANLRNLQRQLSADGAPEHPLP